jgi:hypothetical protein
MDFLSNLFEDLFNDDFEMGSDIEFDNQVGDFAGQENEVQALFALDRMTNDIDSTDIEEIQDYFESKDFDEGQFQGVINNWKGIYSEIEVIDILNEKSDGEIEYRIPTDTTNPGVDIYGLNQDGEIVEKYQVKMSLDKGYLNSTLNDLPDDVKLICPEEIASELNSVAVYDIGLSAAEIESTIDDVCNVLISKEPWESDLDDGFFSWFDESSIKGH